MLLKSPTPINTTAAASQPKRSLIVARSRPSAAEASPSVSRRDAIALLTAAPVALQQGTALAVQGLTAGRIPGLSSTADANGFYQYVRPEGKSGGHGVGWSEIPRYAFKVPAGWEEIPVSIADLGGTEIDLRYQSKDQGDLAIVVAPVLRFLDVGFNAKVRIEDIGSPAKIIKGFGPELFGKPIEDEDILNTQEKQKGSLTYYSAEVKPHNLISVTAFGNRVFIMSLRANSRQWKKYRSNLLAIQDTFQVYDA